MKGCYHFDVDTLNVIQKYCKKIKVFTKDSLCNQQALDEICQMESLEELKISFVVEVRRIDAMKQMTQLKNLKSLFIGN